MDKAVSKSNISFSASAKCCDVLQKLCNLPDASFVRYRPLIKKHIMLVIKDDYGNVLSILGGNKLGATSRQVTCPALQM